MRRQSFHSTASPTRRRLRSRNNRFPVKYLLLVCLPLASLFAPLAAADTWFESYHKAEEALGRESWSEAIGHLNSALEQKPDSAANVRTYGMRFISYFPFLKLGIAYHHLGQEDAALQAFETEERQGEILRSEKDYAELERYRDLILRAKQEAEAERSRRARQLVAENLAAARDLEEQGRFDDALSALARALAVDPDDREAQSLQQRLLAAVAEQERQREVARRSAELVDSGRADLSARRYRRAAISLRQALELSQDDDVQALLEQAQEGIRAEIEIQKNAYDRRRQVARSLERAAELEASGDYLGSLAELQAVLALEPQNTDARARQERIIQMQAAADEAERQSTTIRRLLNEVEGHLLTGNFDQALRSANHVLALEPNNESALQSITRAYAKLNNALLATDNAPPAILVDDLRQEISDGARRQVVRSPEFLLSGTVYDNTPVEVSFRDAENIVRQASVQRREFLGVWITNFRLQHHLPEGISTFEVVAVDEGGVTATEEYSVEYVVPFFLSIWFPVSIGATLASLALGFMASRTRRRHQLLQRRFNPYVAGAPILEQKRFFGRQQLLEYVLRRIYNNSILLYGERRIGKTSLQHQLKKCLTTLDDPDHRFYPVFIDLQGTPQERFFATMAAEIFQELPSHLNGLQPSRPIDHDSYGYAAFVQDIHRILKTLKASTQKTVKLVLLIDEVDELNDYDPRINQKLRSLFMRTFADNLVSVVSGVGIKKQWEKEGSPWYNFFQEIEVKPLDREEAIALIESPVRGVFSFDDGVAEEIIERTRCKPYLIQRICSALVDRLHEQGRRRFTTADLEMVCQSEGL